MREVNLKRGECKILIERGPLTVMFVSSVIIIPNNYNQLNASENNNETNFYT